MVCMSAFHSDGRSAGSAAGAGGGPWGWGGGGGGAAAGREQVRDEAFHQLPSRARGGKDEGDVAGTGQLDRSVAEAAGRQGRDRQMGAFAQHQGSLPRGGQRWSPRQRVDAARLVQ